MSRIHSFHTRLRRHPLSRRATRFVFLFGAAVAALGADAFAQATKLGSEFQVNTFVANAQHAADIAADRDGDFVVTWHSNGQDGFGFGVFARRFSAAGVGVGAEFQVNSYTPAGQSYPSLAMNADGDFVVAWQSDGSDGSMGGVFARRFNAVGAAQGSDFQVNS